MGDGETSVPGGGEGLCHVSHTEPWEEYEMGREDTCEWWGIHNLASGVGEGKTTGEDVRRP